MLKILTKQEVNLQAYADLTQSATPLWQNAAENVGRSHKFVLPMLD